MPGASVNGSRRNISRSIGVPSTMYFTPEHWTIGEELGHPNGVHGSAIGASITRTRIGSFARSKSAPASRAGYVTIIACTDVIPNDTASFPNP